MEDDKKRRKVEAKQKVIDGKRTKKRYEYYKRHDYHCFDPFVPKPFKAGICPWWV